MSLKVCFYNKVVFVRFIFPTKMVRHNNRKFTIKASSSTTKDDIVTCKSPFVKQDFHSKDGMLVGIWGPSMWHVLHTMSFNYPTNPTKAQKKQYRGFILSLQNVLPCGKCRENLKKNLKEHPLLDKHMVSRDTFSRYVYDLHEVVNKMLEKQ